MLVSRVMLACLLIYKIFRPNFCNNTRDLAQERRKFDDLFVQLVSDVTSHLKEEIHEDSIRWLKLVSF